MGAGRLSGEVAIVTGATSGLGREIARVFAIEGAKVVLSGRDRGRGEATAEAITAQGGEASFVRCDLAHEADCVALVRETVERHGTVTVLVNNAVSNDAVNADGPVAAADAATWMAMLQVNLVAPALLCREVIPHMRQAGHGSIVNISSRAAERGTPNVAAYTASKGGLNALARSISVDHGREGIRCNIVQPGYVLNAERDAGASPERIARYRGMHLTRMTTATDVAMAALFLASSESEVITGEVLHVDSGSTAVRATTLG
ncbi:MAG: SDR family NAD(P)-dependent oxidoreductase [Acidimicrobiales bacterium]